MLGGVYVLFSPSGDGVDSYTHVGRVRCPPVRTDHDGGMAKKDELGRAGEDRAVRYLTDAGYDILDVRWRCRIGELDIVASEGAYVVAVEVKTRRSERFGHPFEAITEEKRARLWRLATAWCAAYPEHSRGMRLRLDAVAITGAPVESARVEHLRGLDLR